VILTSWWLKAAALAAKISFTATKFGEDACLDAAQAIPRVPWFFGVFQDFVGIVRTNL